MNGIKAMFSRIDFWDIIEADLDYATRTVMGEARGEPDEGRRAVVHVMLNRLAARHRGETRLAGVCTEPKQFSCWNPGDPNFRVIALASTESPDYKKCRQSVSEALDQRSRGEDPTCGATHYHTKEKPRSANIWPPKWAEGRTPAAQFGSHLFYANIP